MNKFDALKSFFLILKIIVSSLLIGGYTLVYSQCNNENFSADFTNGCVPSTIRFSATGFSTGSSFAWDFGSGFSGSSLGDSVKYHLFSSTGTYSVKLRITVGTSTCLITKSGYITISNGPKIKLYISDPTLCNISDSVTFIDSTTNVVSRDFVVDGNLYKSAGTQIKHKFSAIGPKMVSIKVLTSSGCVASLNKDTGVFVYKPPFLSFNTQSNMGCAPVKAVFIPFVNISGGQYVTGYLWDCPGGSPTTSTLTQPMITYNNTGKYDATLTVKTNTGCEYSVQRKQVAEVYPLPTFSFKFSDTVFCNKGAVDVFNTTSIKLYPGKFSWILPNGASYTSSNSDSDSISISIPVVSGFYDIGMTYSIANCYTDTLIYKKFQVKKTTAVLNSNTGAYCKAPQTISFNDSGSVTDSGYSFNSFWMIRDSLGKILDSGYAHQKNFTFTKLGKYGVELYVRSNSGCSDSALNKDYVVIMPPLARMQFSNKRPCPGEEVTITDATLTYSPDSIKPMRLWTLYDTSFQQVIATDTSKKFKYIFTDTGRYMVRLITYNKLGCADTLYDSVSLYVVGTVVDFVIDRNNLCRNETFKLTASHNADPVKTVLSWKIVNDDDSVFTYFEGNVNPLNKTVGGVGRYSITCTAYTKSCTTSVTKKAILNVSGILYKGILDTLLSCQPVNFKVKSEKVYNFQKNGTDSGLSYRWFSSPPGVGWNDSLSSTAIVSFPSAGCYAINLLVTNGDGCQSNWMNVVNSCVGNNARFTIPGGICYGDSLKPVNLSSSWVKSSRWKISGQGSYQIFPSDTSRNPAILLNDTGWYEIKLYVVNNVGCLDSAYDYILLSRPKASFISKDTLGNCGPHLATFEYNGTPGTDYRWEWGDGTPGLSSTSKFVSHIFDIKKGKNKYSVKCVMTDKYGCMDSVQYPSFVKIAGPVPFFTVTPKAGCEPLQVAFDNLTTGAQTVIFFDDKGSPDSANSTIFYRTYSLKLPGDTISYYQPFMIAYDSTGLCVKAYKMEDTIIIYKKPTANFTFSDSLICLNQDVVYTNTSRDFSRFYWDLEGDGVYTDSISPLMKRFKKKGYFYPSLVAINKGGCSDTLKSTKPVEVFPVVKGIIYSNKKDYCLGDSIDFYTSTDTVYQGLLNYKWYAWRNDTLIDSSNLINPKFRFSGPGYYKLKVIIINIAGCSDTLILDSAVQIHPRSQYMGSNIHFVSVSNNKNIYVTWKKCSSPHFEKYILYKADINGRNIIYETYNIDDTIYTDSTNLDVNNRAVAYDVVTSEQCNPIPSRGNQHTNIVLKAEPFGNNQIRVTWGNYIAWSGRVIYNLYKNSNGTWKKIQSTSLNTWIDHWVCDSDYTYAVYATEKEGDSNYISVSNTASAHPVYIANKTASDIKSVSVVNDESFLITWDTTPAPLQTESYLVYMARHVLDPLEQIAEVTGSTVSFVPGSLDIIHRFCVVRKDICGFYSDTGRYGTNIYLSAQSTDEDLALFEWNSYHQTLKGVKEYQLWLRDNYNFNYNSLWKGSATDTQAVDSQLHNLKDPWFCYRVSSVTKDYPKDTSWSNTSCVNFEARLYIPNSFTPNQDGRNEIFLPAVSFVYGDETTASFRYTFEIYNRWGEKIFETHNPSEGWNGSYQGKEMPEGMYFYRLLATGFKNQARFNERGSLMLFR